MVLKNLPTAAPATLGVADAGRGLSVGAFWLGSLGSWHGFPRRAPGMETAGARAESDVKNGA